MNTQKKGQVVEEIVKRAEGRIVKSTKDKILNTILNTPIDDLPFRLTKESLNILHSPEKLEKKVRSLVKEVFGEPEFKQKIKELKKLIKEREKGGAL